MCRFILLFTILPLLVLTQSDKDSIPDHRAENHRVKLPIENITIGLFNSETGYSLISYSRNILRGSNYNRKNLNYFIACGTNIIQSSITVGAKKPILESSLNKVLYSSVSIIGVYSIGKWDDFIAPSIALSLDIPLSNHPNYKSKHTSKIGEVVNGISPGDKQREFISIGLSSIMRLNENQIKLIMIPNLSLSYRW